ncbi:hypothetical protein HJG54_23155 [Leptolyngbya sp. NK1-12]|uniref:Uncharacterized protein n=1 Tax=Leptolyngbya sp. NK1-12 TaxID=2547451 RepID=A0AA96WHX6_9CYAN|nr:hypothetical protein [Leptolyngbya sp. NK1-12]WNZ25465.1 hypothetical protein HJG54_23155 [Leptolyngbya sp. NK1-12]
MIGVKILTPEAAGEITLHVIMLVLLVGPILQPANRLPEIVQFLKDLSLTYAPSTLQQTRSKAMT